MAKATATKQKKQQAEAKPVKASKQAKAGVDRFGYRIGSNKAKLNALLSKDKPIKMRGPDSITEKLHCPTMYNHVKALRKKGFVKATKEGYLLAK